MSTATPEAAEAAKKPLSFSQGVEAACILFALNTDTTGVLRLAIAAGMPEEYLYGEGQRRMLEEWTAFIHAVVTSGLMRNAPNSVLVAYLRQTKALLQARGGMNEAEADAFIDGPFAAYMEQIALEKQQECPRLFFQRLMHKDLPDVPAACAAAIAGTMAMALAAVLDKLEQYDIAME
ncbi:MAG: serine/threonine protein kinase [Desulfovibrionaceae bacterium]|nr:serine/threonine protein kinase [Desulfovibrionaceae bacterium]